MSIGTNIPHPLRREGTYQFERFPQALKPDYIKIDERSLTDLVRQSAEFAAFVAYYNESNIKSGDWKVFFEEIFDYSTNEVKFKDLTELEKSASTSPHLALFLAFLKIFGIAQNNLNSLTKRHIDFYYQNILQIKPRNENPDKVAVFFEPEKNSGQVKVPQGTSLLAGKDPDGKDLFYKTLSEIIVNKAQVGQIKTLFVNKQTGTNIIKSIHDAQDAPTENLIVTGEETSKGWVAFGSHENTYANVGFAIASPILNLKEGKRRVTLTIAGIENLDRKALIAEYTSEEGWVEAEIDADTKWNDRPFNPHYLLIKIKPGQPPVLPYAEKVHKANMVTKHPVLRIKIRNSKIDEPTFNDAYQILTTVTAANINVTVHVTGLKNMLLQNDVGVLDNTKPFQPFGPSPAKSKSTLYIGSTDVFNKYLQSFSLAINWKGLPGNIRKYYKTYEDALALVFGVKTGDPQKTLLKVTHERDKYLNINQFTDFEPGHPPGKLSILDSGNWVEIPLNQYEGFSDQEHFNPARNHSKTHAYYRNVYKNKNAGNFITDDEYTYTPLQSYNHSAKSGFVKIELGYNFGHNVFQKLFTSVAVYNAKVKAGEELTIPEIPYTPEFNSLHLDYTSAANIGFTAGAENQFFHIGPFGNAQILKADSLVPVYNNQGNLLIGLTNIDKPETVSLYFTMENDSGNLDKSIGENNKITWSYLINNEWEPFKESNILQNTTLNFTSSGLIKFAIDKEAITGHSILPNGMVWLCAGVPQDSEAYSRIIQIKAQAVEAEFNNRNNNTSHLQNGLPESSISKTEVKIDGIKAVTQPYNSFGGRTSECTEVFYTRVSERLRHKNRAWGIWDYERLVLENFPAVFKIKCIPHTTSSSEYATGNVLIVLLPDVKKVHQSVVLQPRVSKAILEQVKQFIAKHTSAFVKTEVINPTYEKLRVICDVKLTRDCNDESFYKMQLAKDLVGFLAPWTVDSNRTPSFEGKIYKSQIIDFIEERPYIDFVTSFNVEKIFTDGTTEICNETISGTKENVILTSNPTHEITTEGAC